MKDALAAIADQVHPEARPGEPLRQYAIRLAAYPEVVNQGEPCTHCQIIGNTVEVNIHATDMNGHPLYEESCSACTVPLLDRGMDVDPSHIVILEVAQLCAP